MTQVNKSQAGHTSTDAQCRPEDLGRIFPTELFRALSDPSRIALLGQLATSCGPQTVTEAAGCCPTDLSVVSRHLALLRDAGIVRAEKRGRQVFYSVRYDELSQALREMADAIDACCPKEEEGIADAAGNGRS